MPQHSLTVNEMTTAPVRQSGTGKPLGRCLDVLVDTDRAQLSYLLLDLGRGLDCRPAVVARGRFAGFSDGDLVIDLRDDEVETKRAAGTDDAAPPDGPLNLMDMPPVVVGPFGSSVAPAMAGAIANKWAERQREFRPDIDKAHAGWHWFDALHGLPMFDTSGALGHLTDIELSPDARDCTRLVALDDDGDRHLFDFAALRNVTRGCESLILDQSVPAPYSAEALRQSTG